MGTIDGFDEQVINNQESNREILSRVDRKTRISVRDLEKKVLKDTSTEQIVPNKTHLSHITSYHNLTRFIGTKKELTKEELEAIRKIAESVSQTKPALERIMSLASKKVV